MILEFVERAARFLRHKLSVVSRRAASPDRETPLKMCGNAFAGTYASGEPRLAWLKLGVAKSQN